jgi:TolB protein
MSRRLSWSISLALLLATVPAALATAPGDNGSIAFRRYLGPDRTKGTIYVANPDGSGERQISNPPRGKTDDYPDFASDGSFVAFQRCGTFCHVYTVRTDGTGLRNLWPGCRRGQRPPRCSEAAYPAISPDRTRIAFEHPFGRIIGDQITHVGIYTMGVDGSDVRRVTLPPRLAAVDQEPQWSPDGSKIVFVRKNATARPAGGQAIFVVNADGTGMRRITPWKLRAGDGPDWSPDGSEILFRSPQTEDFTHSNFFAIHPDGTGLRQITHARPSTKIYSASFSPDGQSITFGMTGVAGNADVYTMNADGSGITPLTRTRRWDSAPDWGGAP